VGGNLSTLENKLAAPGMGGRVKTTILVFVPLHQQHAVELGSVASWTHDVYLVKHYVVIIAVAGLGLI
jgi:hypothetical protein